MNKSFLFISNFYLIAVNCCYIILALVHLLILWLYYQTITNIEKKKKSIKQTIFILVSLFYLSLTFIKSSLVLIIIAIIIIILYLAFY